MEWKELQAALARESYIASNDLVVAMQLALSLERPLLLEGSAGVGKTELARALSLKPAQLNSFACNVTKV